MCLPFDGFPHPAPLPGDEKFDRRVVLCTGALECADEETEVLPWLQCADRQDVGNGTSERFDGRIVNIRVSAERCDIDPVGGNTKDGGKIALRRLGDCQQAFGAAGDIPRKPLQPPTVHWCEHLREFEHGKVIDCRDHMPGRPEGDFVVGEMNEPIPVCSQVDGETDLCPESPDHRCSKAS